ncbi:MAG: tyrosine-type recombinase/integrase [Synergistaceae bacterium]|nr:tyrosine-type recombinase/integrase [Synergistaceae bacterium]
MTNITLQNQSVSFATVADGWREKLRSSGLSAGTVKKYESVLDSKILPRLRDYKLADISRRDCENLIRESSLSAKSLRTMWTVISDVLRHAYDQNLLPERVRWPFPKVLENVDEISETSLPALETAIRENDSCALMSVMLRENISMSNLLALSKHDVNEQAGTITIRNKTVITQNIFKIKQERNASEIAISEASMSILMNEIRKHDALTKKFPASYCNPDGLIFADETGALPKPSYYVSKFGQLSRRAGFIVTPKLLAEFQYSRHGSTLPKYSRKVVASGGKRYTYLKTFVQTDFGRREICARSIDELAQKYQARNDRYAYRLTKNNAMVADYCREELDRMENLPANDKEKISVLLQRYLDPFCGDFTVNQLDDDFQNRFIKYLDAQKCLYRMKKRITNFLKEVCAVAMSKNYIRYNPFADVYLKPDKPLKYHALSEDEIKIIMQLDSSNINNAFLQVALLTGMRTAETRGLSWDDISVDGRHIFVHRQLRSDKEPILIDRTKNYRPRTITPPSLAFEIIEKHRATSHNEKNTMNLVFCNENGKPLSTGLLHKKLKCLVGRKKVRLHDLRVTALTVLYKKTGDLELARHEAGHSDKNVTVQHYVDVIPDLSVGKQAQDEYYRKISDHE